MTKGSSYSPSIVSRTRLFPSKYSPTTEPVEPVIASLSILDSTVVSYSPTAGVWFFDSHEDSKTFDVNTLKRSLSITLDAYPQWTGQMGWGNSDTGRYHRTHLVYGAESDPGLAFIIAECPDSLRECIPDSAVRVRQHDGWDASICRDLNFLPAGLDELALRDVNVPERADTPGVIVQITTFSCGGLAIGVGIAHALADATTLLTFIRDWSTVHCAHIKNMTIPQLSPVFDPIMVDELAGGDIHAIEPDPSILARAWELPIHRYDMFASEPGAPLWAHNWTKVEGYKPPAYATSGTPLPWDEWDANSPVDRVIFYFTPTEIAKMHASASSGASCVSRLDALLAFIWTLNVRARGLEDDTKQVYIDMTLGLRSRTRPQLPATFVGSPLLNIFASLPTSALSSHTPDLAAIANSIRHAVNAFDDPDAIPSYLHERAFDGCPHARWVAFFGRRHTLTTSWLGLDVHNIDFGSGLCPRHVESVMPDVDGCVQIMEAGPGQSTGKWYEKTVGVRMHLRADVMQRLRRDPILHMYD